MSNRKQVIDKAIFHLFDALSSANEKFFRPLTEEAITPQEYGEIQVTAAANYLRYCVFSNIAEADREKAIDLICEGMKVKPTNMDDQEPKLFSDQQKVDFTNIIGGAIGGAVAATALTSVVEEFSDYMANHEEE